MWPVARKLFGVVVWFWLAIALAPDLWKWFAVDDDPRTTFGHWALILHPNDQVVIRTGGGVLWRFNYSVIQYGGIACFTCWLLWFIVGHLSEQGKKRRMLRGHCPRCGYDLRATPDRCPECGAIRSKSAPTERIDNSN